MTKGHGEGVNYTGVSVRAHAAFQLISHKPQQLSSEHQYDTGFLSAAHLK